MFYSLDHKGSVDWAFLIVKQYLPCDAKYNFIVKAREPKFILYFKLITIETPYWLFLDFYLSFSENY